MVDNVITRHPNYSDVKPDWDLMRDAYKGQRAEKNKTIEYLPFTDAQILDGAGSPQALSVGSKAYASYILRARFPNFVKEAIEMAIGMMFSQPPEIKLPDAMKDIRSSKNESMNPHFLCGCA